mgnify:CR=1 FL=1
MMLDKIKALLLESGMKDAGRAAKHGFSERDIAIAVLLLDTASSDGDYAAIEHGAILALLQRKLNLDETRAKALVALADVKQQDAVELFRFTDAVNRALSEDEKAGLVEMLWEVVYADGVLDNFEENLVRKIAGLLHVSDRARGDARKRALARRDATGPEAAKD